MKKKLIYLFILFFFTSCSVIQKTAVNTTADIAEKGQYQIQQMNSWEQVKSAIPAQLAFAETLLPSNPENTVLLGQLIKGYTAQAFVIEETAVLLFDENKELKSYHQEQTNLSYSRAINFGQIFFKIKGINWTDLYIAINDEKKLFKLLDDHLAKTDEAAVFFIGQAWASLINLNRDNMKLVNHLPVARALINYTCQKNPNFENGMCPVFEAIYQLSRPKILGGNPELGYKIFTNTIAKYPNNLLYPILYAQYGLMPQAKLKEWNELKKQLTQKVALFWKAQQYPKYIQSNNEFYQYPENNLYNMLASIRLNKLLTLEKKFK